MEVKTKVKRKTPAKKENLKPVEKKVAPKKATPKPETKKSPVKKPAKKPVKAKPQQKKDFVKFNVKAAREKQGFTAKKLAELSGAADTTILAIEKGISDPKFSTMAKLADALGYEIVFLVK